ncbi:MAG TPA: FAD-binding oxidoreductase, partial [Salinivirgaceae bacterium]|nr:FAD-binding oxidoreductase [Salinivirgaceae bacterium]
MDLHKKIPDIEIKTDYTTRVLYATDASIYRELPRGVIYPKNAEEVKSIIKECFEQRIPLISRGAGTSLAGQVVGNGFVIDFSRYMNRVLELNTREKWVWVEPGVVLDQLNEILKPHGLFFGPETSTGSRCTLGGMVGNNSCGSHSLLYKTTREHLLEVECVLADGSIA